MPETIIGEPEMNTFWEQRVNVIYRDDKVTLSNINKIRELSAELIDLLEDNFKWYTEFCPERKRVYANAQTEIEWACMWAIKAICK